VPRPRREPRPTPRNPAHVSSVLRDILDRSAPTPSGWKRALFHLARELKAVAPDAEPDQLRPVVQMWYDANRPVLGGKEFAFVWSLFFDGWDKVKVPAGTNPVDLAWERAQKVPPPQRAVELYGKGPAAMLASLCRELQRAVGDADFCLDCRKAGKKTGLHFGTAWRYLKMFCADGLLRAGAKGTQGTQEGGKANEYRYLGVD
jgi:hypothetical protein